MSLDQERINCIWFTPSMKKALIGDETRNVELRARCREDETER